MRSYSPAEFLSKLSANELPDPTEVTIVGLAKADEKDPAVIYFSNSPSCEKWLSVPTEIIDSIEHLKMVACKDHQHPVVRIKFQRPDDAHPDVAFFLNLVSTMQGLISRMQRVVRAGGASRRSAGSQAAPCWIAEGPLGLEVCCYDDENPDIACTGMV